MRKLKEVLRLHALGLSQHQIARSCSISQSTVHDYLSAAQAAGLQWPAPENWSDRQIEQALAKEKEGTCRIIEKKDVRIRRCTRVIHEDAEIRYVKPKHVDVSINVSEGKTERHIKSKESKSVTESDSFDGESNTLTHTTTEHILVNRSHDYPKYVMRDNEVLRILAGKISEDYLTLEEKAQALICFVQTAIAYDDRGLPKGDMDYVKNPIKTLMDRKGDCKDKSVLYASLLTYIGVNPVFITYKNHVNVGVPLDFENNRVAPEGMVLDGKVKHKGKTYFIVETTLDNPCYIGRLNKSGKNRKIREIFPLN